MVRVLLSLINLGDNKKKIKWDFFLGKKKSAIKVILSPIPLPLPLAFQCPPNRQYPRHLHYMRYCRSLEIFLSQETMTVIPLDTKVFLCKLH